MPGGPPVEEYAKPPSHSGRSGVVHAIHRNDLKSDRGSYGPVKSNKAIRYALPPPWRRGKDSTSLAANVQTNLTWTVRGDIYVCTIRLTLIPVGHPIGAADRCFHLWANAG